MSSDDYPLRYSGRGSLPGRGETMNLAELLERILDKGIIIAGDIAINLVDIELLTIKIRLLIASVDKAREIGVNWWESDPWLSSQAGRSSSGDDNELSDGDGVGALRQRIDQLESRIQSLGASGPSEDEGRATSSRSKPTRTRSRASGQHDG